VEVLPQPKTWKPGNSSALGPSKCTLRPLHTSLVVIRHVDSSGCLKWVNIPTCELCSCMNMRLMRCGARDFHRDEPTRLIFTVGIVVTE
jgi:hypothetical protein